MYRYHSLLWCTYRYSSIWVVGEESITVWKKYSVTHTQCFNSHTTEGGGRQKLARLGFASYPRRMGPRFWVLSVLARAKKPKSWSEVGSTGGCRSNKSRFAFFFALPRQSAATLEQTGVAGAGVLGLLGSIPCPSQFLCYDAVALGGFAFTTFGALKSKV